MKSSIILFLILLCTANIFPQGYFIYENYTFLNSDVSSNVFITNPAVLGQGEKFNSSLNIYYNGWQRGINNFDVSASFGSIGLGYHNYYSNSDYSFDDFTTENITFKNNKYNFGIGFGDKKFSYGTSLSFENRYLSFSRNIPPSKSEIPKNHLFQFLSTLYKPNEYISIGASTKLRHYNKTVYKLDVDDLTVGFGIRPFGNDRLSMYVDLNNDNLKNRFEIDDIKIKAGVEFKIIDGLRIGGVYGDRFSGFNLGLNFGNLGLRNHTVFFNHSGSTAYSAFSLQYFHEKRDNIIPKPNSVLEISLAGGFQDFYSSPVLFGFLGGEKKPFEELIQTIYDASENDNVKGILLRIDPLSAGSRFGISANIEELGNAILNFRSKNKKVVSYISEVANIPEYYLANFTDKIVMPRESYLNYGLSIDVLNYKQFLANLGIELEPFFAGDYKLTFQGLLDSTSTEGDFVINRILDVVYDEMLDRVSKSRSITINDDTKKLLSTPLNGSQLLANKLIDRVGWYEDAKTLAKSISGTKNISSVQDKYEDTWGTPENIAVIGVYSSITTGESSAPPLIRLPINIPFLSQGRTTGSQTILRQLESAFSNPNIKAVVLRVNSGGGSAIASSEIYSAIKRLKQRYKKPFIVSMGNAAASGGYYISAGADKIFGSKTTVTGSIGVFGGFPKIDSLMRQLKIKAQNYSRGELSDINSPYVEFSEEQIQVIQDNINYLYRNFLNDVAEGRKLPMEIVEEVSQGIVWLGIDALDRNLIDEIGGMREAVEYAKKLSGINKDKKINLVYYPVAGSSLYELEGINSSTESSLIESAIKFLGF